MNQCSTWTGKSVSVLILWLQPFKSYDFFQSHAQRKENDDRQYIIANSSIYKNPSVSSIKLKQTWRVHYFAANGFMYIIG